MTVRALTCPSCGAPLPEHAWKTRVTCAYCHATVMVDRQLVNAADLLQMEKAAKAGLSANAAGERVMIDDDVYLLRDLIAAGDSSDVHWGTRVWPPSLVTLKVLRSDETDETQLFAREIAAIEKLATLLADRPGLALRVPRLVQHGMLQRKNHPPRRAMALRYPSGFVHTFEDVQKSADESFNARHLVWMWRRVLELLAPIHQAGMVHGAITPAHLLVHARDHGVNLIGWSWGGPAGRRRTATTDAIDAVYPKGAKVSPYACTAPVDLAMSARSLLFAAGQCTIPSPIRQIIDEVAQGTASSATDVEHRLVATARDIYGPPSYEKLVLPGWH